jgi:hypothetical protein
MECADAPRKPSLDLARVRDARSGRASSFDQRGRKTTAAGRFLAYGWSWEGLTEQGREEQGWAGCLTLPREIGFRDGQVTYRLGADLTSFRSGHWGIRDAHLATGRPGLEHTAGSRAAEIRLVLQLGADSGFDLVFCSSPDGQEQAVIRYRAAGASLESS